MQQLNLHPRYVKDARAHAEKHFEFQTWFYIDVGDMRVVLFLPPGAFEQAQQAATLLNAAFATPYPEPVDDEPAEAS
jgi:hypothetical protein